MNSRKGPSVYIRLRSKNLKLIFKGIKLIAEESTQRQSTMASTYHSMTKGGFITAKKTHRYNKFKPLLLFCSVTYLFFYLRHNYFRFEYQKMKQPNILIPKFIYRIRREHYIYWEKSRLARGLPSTFSYYEFDNEAVSH